MPVFRFKQFNINDEDCAMKIGTDAVLLGSWTKVSNEKRILDIGTGCGVLAMMLAQKSQALIDAIEIDTEAATRAEDNFKNSPWNDRLNLFCKALADFVQLAPVPYDMVISNPPFFVKSLKSPSYSKNIARHDLLLPPEQLAKSVDMILNVGGRFNLILPFSQEKDFVEMCAQNHLYPVQITRVIPITGKGTNRVLLSLMKGNSNLKCSENELIIRVNSSDYSSDYRTLTREFLLNS